MTEYATTKKAAFLVENGFCERELVQAENALKSAGFSTRIISANTPLIDGWREEKGDQTSNWGQKYAAQGFLNNERPSDYEVLVIPGGQRSIDKLIQEKDLKSFISGFMAAGKPVVAYNKAIDLFLFHDLIRGYSIAATNKACDILNQSGSRCVSDSFVVSKNLITLSRYRDVENKIAQAVKAILNNEPYVEKVVSSDTLPKSYQAA